MDSIEPAKQLALTHPKVFASFGCHPKSSWSYNSKMEAQLLEAFSTCGRKAIAWGEFGLDYSNDWSLIPQNRINQQQVFERQLQLAIERNLPLVLHVRDATTDALKILRKWVPRHYKAHLHANHCVQMVKAVLNEWPNFYIGMTASAGMAGEGRQIGKVVPLDRLLLETDSPYIVPRGAEFNHPGQIPGIAKTVAWVKKCSVKDVMEAARKNTRYIYGI